MANLYGVANAPSLPVLYNTIGSADVACPGGTETNFIQTPALIAPSQGFFYVQAWLAVHMLLGATVPTSIVIAIRIGNGADLGSLGLDNSLFTPSSHMMIYGSVFSPAFQTAWQGGGTAVQLSCNCGTNAATVKFPSTNCLIGMFRAPDQ